MAANSLLVGNLYVVAAWINNLVMVNRLVLCSRHATVYVGAWVLVYAGVLYYASRYFYVMNIVMDKMKSELQIKCLLQYIFLN